MRLPFKASLPNLILLVASALACLPQAYAVAPANSVDFVREVKPIMEAACVSCHAGNKPKGGFSLINRTLALRGGDDQVDIVPGHADKSPLVQFISRVDPDSAMPPAGKGVPLTPAQISIVRNWINQGAVWSDGVTLVAPVAVNQNSHKYLPPAVSRPVDFVKEVQPILAENCYGCHGPKRQESQVRWDNREIALQGGEHGPDIRPGHSADSRLIQLVSGWEPELMMPQKSTPLTPAQIGLLRAWIDQGAVWPDSASVKVEDPRHHWAFRPPVRPALPIVKNKDWPRNPIDYFVLARLEAAGHSPSPPADPRTLLRRMSLDITGLPPTLDEITAFLADKNNDATDHEVDRLLASPHYGELWARHWLDAAHYADSNGYEKDLARSIYPYRDWVIDAYNNNMPFDQFAIKQMAGDLLPNPTINDKVATGFLRNSMLNEEGGVDPEQFRVESIIERMDVLGKTFLGLTVNCCQCHNHKYDPISQKEYYRLFAFLNNDDEPLIEVPKKADEPKRLEIVKHIADLDDSLWQTFPDTTNKMMQWEADMKTLPGNWTTLAPDSYYGSVGAKFTMLEDHSLLCTGSSPPITVYTVTAHTDLTNITGFKLEALTDANLPFFGPGRAVNGNFVLSEFTVAARSSHGSNIPVTLDHASADFSQPGFPVASAIDGVVTNKLGWAVEDLPGRRNRDRQAVFETKAPIGFAGGTTLKFTLNQTFGTEHTLGRFRLSVSTNQGSLRADPLTHNAREILAMAPASRTLAQERELFDFYRLTDPRFAEINQKIDQEQNQWPPSPSSMVLQATAYPRPTHIFTRGDWQKPGALVTPGVPSVLNPLPTNAPLNRLTLARWLVDRKNPTVARVIVNRMWQEYFGRGLVATSENFGTQGDAPTHPQLLDWLAAEFMDSGWDVKHMQRLIANSATYHESSIISPKLWEDDQYNETLARGPRFRVDAETIRDIALSAGGLLNPAIGGPSVFPPIPDGVMALGYGTPMKWKNKDKADDFRRGLYIFAKRSVPYPSLQVFDAPSGESPCPRRVRSNTPLQALTTLNDPVFVEAAQAMAMRIWKEGGKDDTARLDYAFALCTGREPDARESATILSLLHDSEDLFDNQTTRAIAVASPDVKNPPENVNLHKVAAWTMVSRVLLNLDETVTQE